MVSSIHEVTEIGPWAQYIENWPNLVCKEFGQQKIETLWALYKHKYSPSTMLKREWSTDLWERDIDLRKRERKSESGGHWDIFGPDFKQKWEIERADQWVICSKSEEQRWQCLVMELERNLIILENRESERGRIVNVLARKVGESVGEWGFGAEVFLSVWLCEKMLNKMWPFN